MSNRGLAIISILSGLIAVVVFIMVISAYAGSGGGGIAAGPAVPKETPGQPVDSDLVYGSGGGNQASSAPAATPQPVSTDQSGSQSQSQSGSQPVTAPSANAPANPFTSGIH